MRTTAPCAGAGRFSNVRVAPDRSSKVLAMKKPSPRPEMLALFLGRTGRPCRHVRVAEAVHYVCRETRAVVGNGDRDLTRRLQSARISTLFARKVDGVLDEVAEPEDDARLALPNRLAGFAVAGC